MKHYEIWQIKKNKDVNYIFRDWSCAKDSFSLNDYSCVYSDTIADEDGTEKTNEAILERLFHVFNVERPQNFYGHSMSVSDVVIIRYNAQESVYYCDDIGWQLVTNDDDIYYIHKDNMDRLEKKLTRIKNKCNKFDCVFEYQKIEETTKPIVDEDGRVIPTTFVKVKVFGKAKLNDWEFVASLDHYESGNVIRKMGEREIPKKYYHSNCYCEHCNSSRYRKKLFVVYNTKLNEYKQVGANCLCDYTGGLSASNIANYISMFDSLMEFENVDKHEGIQPVIDTEVALLYIAETVKKFGYKTANCGDDSTANKAINYWGVSEMGWYNHPFMLGYKNQLISEMKSVNFNPYTESNKKYIAEVCKWIEEADDFSNWMHNLKTLCKLEKIQQRHFGILASVFPAFDKSLVKRKEEEQKRLSIAEQKALSEYVGNVKDRITVSDLTSFRCVSSWETQFGRTYLYKFVDENHNVYTWFASSCQDQMYENDGMQIDASKIVLVGTVKEHKEYNGEKQTILTRCKIKVVK